MSPVGVPGGQKGCEGIYVAMSRAMLAALSALSAPVLKEAGLQMHLKSIASYESDMMNAETIVILSRPALWTRIHL